MTMEEDVSAKKIYEVSFLIVPTIPEEKIAGRFGDLKAYLETKGAVFISEDMPRALELAYEMSRTIANKKTWFNNAYFGWIKCELPPEAIATMSAELERDEDILRFMILSTVRESTLASKKPAYGAMGRRKPMAGLPKKEGETAEPELSKEQIYAEIDALVVDEKAA